MRRQALASFCSLPKMFPAWSKVQGQKAEGSWLAEAMAGITVETSVETGQATKDLSPCGSCTAPPSSFLCANHWWALAISLKLVYKFILWLESILANI